MKQWCLCLVDCCAACQVPEAERPYRRRVCLMLVDGLTHEDKPEDYRSALMPNSIDLAALNIQVGIHAWSAVLVTCHVTDGIGCGDRAIRPVEYIKLCLQHIYQAGAGLMSLGWQWL